MKQRRLYISDLDGTLLRSGARLSDYSYQVLKRLLASGLPFTVATARSIVSVREILGDLPLELPVICGNGAYMAYLHDQKHWFTRDIPKPRDREIMEMVHEHELTPFLSAYDGRENRLFMPYQRNAGTQWYWEDRTAAGDPRLREHPDLYHCLQHQILSLNVIGRQEPIYALEQSIRQKFSRKVEVYMYEKVHNGHWNWLSVYDSQATKANAIAVLLDNLKLSAKDVTVFGDSLNDLSMFELAGHSVAVSNARPALMALADEVIDSHESDSVVSYLEKEIFV
jgi:Cof subfamily protein (haloacid dehalogenase superfamily)